MPWRGLLHTILFFSVTVVGQLALSEDMGRFRLGKSNLTLQVATIPPHGARADEIAKPLAARQMSSLLVTIQDQNGNVDHDVESVVFNAEMPEHSHGMNVKPTTTKEKAGTFRIDGVKLHMPGFWKLTFTVKRGGVTEVVEVPLTV